MDKFETSVISVDSPLDEARSVFKKGGLIAFPTETFYGLGVDPFDIRAVERLFLLKGREEKNPVSVIVSGEDMLATVAKDISPAAQALMKRFWPGPLTIVLKALDRVPPSLIANTGKIGVRVPGSPFCLRLLSVLKSPLTATSANPAGKSPAMNAREVLGYFSGRVDLVIDGGTLRESKGSTVVDATGEAAVIIREGEIPAKAVKEALG